MIPAGKKILLPAVLVLALAGAGCANQTPLSVEVIPENTTDPFINTPLPSTTVISPSAQATTTAKKIVPKPGITTSTAVRTKPKPKNKPPLDTQILYKYCRGLMYEPLCRDKLCIADGFERRVFNLWKDWFKAKHGLSEAYFNAHFDVIDVSARIGPPFSYWKITYFFHFDYLRFQDSDIIWLPFDESNPIQELTDDQIKTAINKFARPIHLAGIFNINRVISRSTLDSLLQKTYRGAPLTYDFCHIRIRDKIILTGTGTISEDKNQCVQGNIDLIKGTMDFKERVCVIIENW